MPYLYLALAIILEVTATSALKATEGFTRWRPSLVAVIGYVFAFYFLSLTLKTVPVGIAYAIWCGVGIALVTLIAWRLYEQHLDLAAWIGLSLIVAGVLVLQLFSKTSVH